MRLGGEWVCYMRTANPKPATLIPDDEHVSDEDTDGNDDATGGEPGYGTGIAWNELHTPSDTPTPRTDHT